MSAVNVLNKEYSSNMRLSIAVMLYRNGAMMHSALKAATGLSDGNIASHIKSLEQAKYVSVSKSIVDKKVSTRYSLTKVGRSALVSHVRALYVLCDGVV